jgi:hypothetical protein
MAAVMEELLLHLQAALPIIIESISCDTDDAQSDIVCYHNMLPLTTGYVRAGIAFQQEYT